MKGRWAALAVSAAGFAGASLTPVSAAGSLEGLPAYDHVVVLVLENESFASTFSATSPAHYLNGVLVPHGVLDDQYYGTGHVSLDNYIAMTSGQSGNGLTNSDCSAVSLYACAQSTLAQSNGANLGDQLDSVGRTWKGYMDTMPSACFHQTYAPTTTSPDPYQGDSQTAPAFDYADRHNPFIYYPDIVGDDPRCQAHDVPYAQLSGDLSTDALPNFSFVTPDTCHDGHDNPCSNGSTGGLVSADAWLQSNVPPLLSYLNGHHGLLIVTFDEAANTDVSGCCHGGPGGQRGEGGLVGLLALGPGVKAGQVVHTQYDHASLLRTVEDLNGIGTYLNNAAASSPMTDLFATPETGVPEAPTIAGLAVIGAAAALLLAGLRRRRTPTS
jgi:phosphatidylinositol-3-phosphatase